MAKFLVFAYFQLYIVVRGVKSNLMQKKRLSFSNSSFSLLVFGEKVFTCHLYSFFHFVFIPSPSRCSPNPPFPRKSLKSVNSPQLGQTSSGRENTVVCLNNICLILVLEVVPFQVGDRHLVRVCQTQISSQVISDLSQVVLAILELKFFCFCISFPFGKYSVTLLPPCNILIVKTKSKKKSPVSMGKKNFNLLLFIVLIASGCVPHLILVMDT